MDCCQLLPDCVDLGLILVGRDGRILVWNRWIEERAGLSSEQALGLTLAEAFGPHVDPRVALVVREALDFGWSARLSHALHPMPLPLFPPGGGRSERMKQSIDVTPLSVGEGNQCLLQVRDVTETVRREALLKQQSRQLRADLHRLTRAQAELQRSEMRFRELARQAPAGLFEADARACCTFLNERCEQLLGQELVSVAGTPWINLLPLSEQTRVRKSWCQAVESATRFSEEFRFTRPDGSYLWMRAEAGPLRDESGRIGGFIGTMLDVTELHERATRNEFRANHDGLTSLLNRDRFERHLRAAISGAREVSDRLALLFIDLDDFKGINDNHGHTSGDTVLKAVAARVRRVLRSEDLVARYGGDEFAVLITGAGDPENIDAIIAKINQAVAMPINLGHCHVRVACSIGLAVFPDHGTDPATLLNHADKAMYCAKRTHCVDTGSSAEPV
ncbi:MAG: diguanylate cyclase [Zoogloea sp.]|nr:diguanylate cyclase [Zoogloea sp.]